LTSAPVFFGITGSTIEDKLSIAIARGIDRHSSNIANLLSNLGIRYVVVDESTNPSFDPSASSYKTVEHFLNEADALHVVSRFGSLLLYELNVYQPIFSTTTNFQLLSPNMNRTDIALSGISPEYGNGTLSITQDGIQTLCRIKQPSDYCDFGLGGLNYDVETLPFFILQFSSDAHSTVSMSFTEVNGTSYWPLALDANSPTYNRYNSTVPVVIAYNLRDVFSSSLKAIHVHVNADSSASPNSTLGIAITGAYMAETPPQLTIDAVISFLSNHNLALHPAVFSNENVFFESQNLSGRVPSLTFDKVDPGSYAIHVSNATSSFFLLFDEMYDDSWFASANSQPNTGFLHFQGNGFQNAWLIDKTGSYDIEIRYTPQALFNFWERMGLALTLSIFSSVLAIESKTRLRSLLRMTLARARSKFGLRRS